MRERFQRVSLTAITRTVMIDTHDELEDANRKQLYAGKRPDGSDITPEYRPLTKFLKQQKGQVWDRVTLEDTGAFYRGIDLQLSNVDYELTSTDYKTPDLLNKYGDVFGLSDQAKDDYRADTLKPRVVEAICEQTGAIAR